MTAFILPTTLHIPFPCFLAMVGAALLYALVRLARHISERSKKQNKSS